MSPRAARRKRQQQEAVTSCGSLLDWVVGSLPPFPAKLHAIIRPKRGVNTRKRVVSNLWTSSDGYLGRRRNRGLPRSVTCAFLRRRSRRNGFGRESARLWGSIPFATSLLCLRRQRRRA